MANRRRSTGRRANRARGVTVQVRDLGLGEDQPACGERVTRDGGIEFGEWDFGDGRGPVAFELVVRPGECLCTSCRLTRARIASLGAFGPLL